MLHKNWPVKELSFSTKLKLLADENIKFRLVKFLINEGVDIKYESKGLRNSALFKAASGEGRVLLTHDKDFLNTEQYPVKSCSGIIVLSIHPPDISKFKSAVLRVLNTFSEEELKGKVFLVKEEGITTIE